MKKTILAVLMIVIVATPCLAQEVELDGIFSIEGTLWRGCKIGFFTLFPFIPIPFAICPPGSLGFYEGTVYACHEMENGTTCYPSPNFNYIDSPVVSIVNAMFFQNWDDWALMLYIIQPDGLGFAMDFGCFPPNETPGGYKTPLTCQAAIGIMFKIEDNWKPPENEPVTE